MGLWKFRRPWALQSSESRLAVNGLLPSLPPESTNRLQRCGLLHETASCALKFQNSDARVSIYSSIGPTKLLTCMGEVAGVGCRVGGTHRVSNRFAKHHDASTGTSTSTGTLTRTERKSLKLARPTLLASEVQDLAFTVS